MTKFYYTFFWCFLLTTISYAQVAKTLLGKWVLTKYTVTWEKKQETKKIDAPGIYEFKPDSSYILTCTDLWGKAKIIGKWKPIGSNKFYLYDTKHISEVKGELPVSNGTEVKIITINKRPILYIASSDTPSGDLHELYYEKTK